MAELSSALPGILAHPGHSGQPVHPFINSSLRLAETGTGVMCASGF